MKIQSNDYGKAVSENEKIIENQNEGRRI